jgi:uncharacterized protein (DUF2141 family)
MILALLAAAAPLIPSSPTLGIAEGRCRPDERGPAVVVEVLGLKDRTGLLKLEVYPSNDADFLADDNILIMAGKAFRRVEQRIPPNGPVRLCIRVPAAGAYSLSLLHDRNTDRRFSLSSDGIGFTGNPKLGWSKPKAASARLNAGPGLTPTGILLNYRRGPFRFAPLSQ